MHNNSGLVLTLGHNSSAILILDNKIINGYQNERITGVKGDSSFPKKAIEEIAKFDSIPDGINIYISHWNPYCDINKMSKKHYDKSYIEKNFKSSTIFQCNKNVSHHDAHAHSIISYNNKPIYSNSFIIVADGFGNDAEVISIYKIVDGEPEKVEVIKGYQNSLGLLYQYSTEYVGLIGNRDEWKLNAYSNQASRGESSLAILYSRVYTGRNKPKYGLDFSCLDELKEYIYHFYKDPCVPCTKSFISVFLQHVVQSTLLEFIYKYNMENIYLVGGCFLNVQLNGYLLDKIKGKICVNPLSGDEGAGLGLFRYFNKSFKMPTSLCIGKRKFEYFPVVENLIYLDKTENLTNNINYLLSKNKIVNVIRGKMEFGPRAYCNTSTICLASEENKQAINLMNSRPGVMPMCPVMTEEQSKILFPDISRVVRSHRHMVIALKSKNIIPGVYYKTLQGEYTYRPQVVDDKHYMHEICSKNGILINTSFNNHGYPICYTLKDVIRTHEAMRKVNKNIATIVEVN